MSNDLTIVIDPPRPPHLGAEDKIAVTLTDDGRVVLYVEKVALVMSPDLAQNIAKGLHEKVMKLRKRSSH